MIYVFAADVMFYLAICIFLQVILLVLINSDFNKKKLEGSPYKLERQV